MWTSQHQTKVVVHIAQTGECYECGTDESLLKGMLRLGRKGIPCGCVNGGCGVCKVRVAQGHVHQLGPVSRVHVSEDEEAQGYTLACRVAPLGVVRLEVDTKLSRPLCKPLAPKNLTDPCPTRSPKTAPQLKPDN